MMSDLGVRPEAENLGCMEVWGGRRPARQTFARPGLDVSVWSQTTGAEPVGGGDIYYMSSCASGRITRMLVADICASGHVFEELAVALRTLMMRNVNAIRQARFVSAVHRQLSATSQRGGFASLLVSTYFAPTRSFTLCNAGHPPPLLYQTQQGTWSVMKQAARGDDPHDGPPGVLDEGEYQHFASRLQPGDMVLTYSDALTECRDRCGQVLGVSGLVRLLNTLDATSPDALADSLVCHLRERHADNLVGDDTTLLLCRATTTPVGVANNLLAPFRLLGKVRNSTVLGG